MPYKYRQSSCLWPIIFDKLCLLKHFCLLYLKMSMLGLDHDMQQSSRTCDRLSLIWSPDKWFKWNTNGSKFPSTQNERLTWTAQKASKGKTIKTSRRVIKQLTADSQLRWTFHCPPTSLPGRPAAPWTPRGWATSACMYINVMLLLNNVPDVLCQHPQTNSCKMTILCELQ